MKFNFKYLLAVLLISTGVKCSEASEGEIEPLTGIFDKITGPLSIESIQGIKAQYPKVLVYGMQVKPPVEIINYALDNNMADVNAFDAYGRCSLSYALDNKDFEAAEALIARGADVNAFKHNTILVMIARAGNLEAFKFLLAHGADIHSTGNSRATLLEAAAEGGNFEIVKTLVDLGCDVNEHSHYAKVNISPLMGAAGSYGANVEIVKYLLEKGARIEDTNTSGNNAIHYAINYWNWDVLKVLLNSGGRELIQSEKDYEKLMEIARYDKHREIVKSLISEGKMPTSSKSPEAKEIKVENDETIVPAEPKNLNRFNFDTRTIMAIWFAIIGIIAAFYSSA